MSRAPYSLPKAESGFPFGNLTAYDTALGWRYPNPKMAERYGTDPMGETAENIADRYAISRAEQDRFAVQSHRRAVDAIDKGKFKDEIVPELKFDGPGVVGMANSGADTNGSQFFITRSAIPTLDGRFTIFGKVIKGIEVLSQLTARDPSTGADLPPGDTILKVTIDEK
jgi:cyclophilin family peptidyl-prolyl cis-trans isomerase